MWVPIQSRSSLELPGVTLAIRVRSTEPVALLLPLQLLVALVIPRAPRVRFDVDIHLGWVREAEAKRDGLHIEIVDVEHLVAEKRQKTGHPQNTHCMCEVRSDVLVGK